MNADRLNRIMVGVLEVIDQCFQVECHRGRPHTTNSDVNLGHLAAVIRIKGDVNGAFVITLGEEDATKIASSLISEEKRFIDKDVMDAIGELINMITGHAKAKLTEIGLTFKLSTPAYVLGKGTRLFKDEEYAPYICVPFSTSVGNFTIMVAVH